MYICADVVGDLITSNNEKFSRNDDQKRRFIKLDITNDRLPQVDLILCRDGLVHLSTDDALRAVKNIKATNAKYLLVTTFPETKKNSDIINGQWRSLNMELAPFCFPPPLRLISEEYTGHGGTYTDRSIGMWKLDNITI
jgi:hypothetical protein